MSAPPGASGCSPRPDDAPRAHLHRRTLPRSARRVLADVVDDVGTASAADAGAACEQLRWRLCAGLWRLVGDLEANPEVSTSAVASAWAWASQETAARLRPPKTEEPSKAHADRALLRARERAEGCRTCGLLLRDEVSGGVWDAPMRCDTRWCRECLRGQLRATMARWAPLFAAPIRPGYRLEMFTVGAWGHARNRDDTGAHIARIGRLVQRMRQGVEECAILPDTWVGGLRVTECVPKEKGWFVHGHLVVARRAYYPYGLSLTRMSEALRGRPLTDGEERVTAVAYGFREPRTLTEARDAAAILEMVASASPEQRGAREVMRRCGLGEVGRHDILTGEGDGEKALTAYLEKVERYLELVEGEEDDAGGDCAGLAWRGRMDIQRAMRGRRLMDAFGAVRGLLAHPDHREQRLDGVGMRLYPVRMVDYSDPGTWSAVPLRLEREGEGVERHRTCAYALDKLETWGEWADVEAIRAWLDAREGPPAPAEPPPLAVALAEARGRPVADVDPTAAELEEMRERWAVMAYDRGDYDLWRALTEG